MNARCQPAQEAHGQGHLAVVDDDPALPGLLARQFEQTGEPWRVTAYRTGAEALAGVAATTAQVVLLGETLPDGCGIACAQKLRVRLPELPVVILAAQGCPVQLQRALLAGVTGYVVKSCAGHELLPLLRKALAGRFALCAQAERLLPRAFVRPGPRNPWGLTHREQEVMHWLCREKSDKEISGAMGLATATVQVHLKHAFHKLGVHDRRAAVEKYLSQIGRGGVEFSLLAGG